MAKDIDSRHIEEKDVDTVLAEDIDFSGTMKFKNSLMIKGKFDGQIDATGHLILGPHSEVKATIRAGVVTNYGKVTGNVEAIEKLELLKGAELNGDVKTPDLIIESGCTFNGKCTMGGGTGGGFEEAGRQQPGGVQGAAQEQR
ncbi:MAG: bactofilin family protein [Spirochaetota bacterium]